MRRNIQRRILSAFLSLSLLLQSYAPLLILPVYADDSTPSAETTEVTPTPGITPADEISPTPEPTVEITPEPTPAITPEATPSPTTEVTPTPEITPTEIPEVKDEPSSNTDSQAPPQEYTTPTPTPEPTPEKISTPTSLSIAAEIESPESTPTLSTDKSDYFPTEIVHITGVNFAPNTDYKLHISSSDSPFVSIYINVTSNENGVISYSYQLDGRYRPNYSIEALDSENNVIVSYLFTDADPQITYDSFEGEISPISSNNWTKGNISGYKEGDTIRFRLNLDSDPGTLSGDLFVGFTSAPACRFFKYQDPTSISLDFDRNTNAIDSGSGFSVNYIGLSQNGSDGVAHFAISSTAAKAVRLNFTLQVDDSAAGCASGSSQHVQVDRATGNIKDSGAKALPIPASAVVPVTDITISKTGPSTASIGETLSYNLQVTNLDANTSAQSVSISDTLPAGTTFISASGATCSSNSGTITCNLGTMAGGSSKTVTINVSVNNNESICGTTITNTATLATTTIESDLTNNSSSASTSINSCSGTVELQKVWIGIGGQTTLNIGTTAGDDDIDSQITGVSGASPLTTGSISVPTGTYYVSETGGLEGYSSSLTCTDNASPVTPGTSNSVYVSAGHTLICTFTNTKLGLSVTKTANPTSLTEPGGVSTFTVRVSNPNAVSVNLTSLTDDVYGDLNTQGNCSIPQTIAASDYYECSFTKPISGNSGTTHTNTVTAVASGVTATDSETVTITDVNPSVEVTKTANPTSLPETGGNVTYTYTVKNTSNAESATITALSDDKLGVLAGDADCYVGLLLSTGASCSFDVNTSVSGNSGSSLTNIFTATVRDDENNSVSDTDDATVSFSDVLPTVELTKSVDQNSRPEPGGDFVFTLSIKNTSSEPVSITSLSDSYTLSDQCNNLVGTSLSAGATTTCSYTVSKSLVGSYLNTANVVVTDDDGSTANDSDSENISVTDVKPTINVSKTASVSTLSEPGGTITYTFTVANTSSVDSVTITKLYDDKFGDLIGDSDCQLNTVLGVGESCSFSLNKSLLFDAGYIHTNVFSAEAKDDENNIATDSDDETVTINNVDPSVTIDKTVTPSELPEPGGIFTYTLTVQNTSVEDVTITSLTDSNTLSQECLDLVGDILTPNQIVTCSYTVTRSESGTYDNTATVVVSDNETKTATDSDSESVKVIDVTPSITVTKTANVSSVNYPGANVLYTFMVQNNSVESVTITTISDDKFTLVGDADCQVGVVLAAGDSCSFSETHYVSGPVETTHRNTVIVKAVDNEKNEASSSDYEDVRINFVEVSISGQKFNDYNGNGQKDTSESGISGWTINLLNTSNEVIATTTTDSSGNFTFSNLGPGIYRVREVGQSGWTQTTDNPTDITVASGQNISGIEFGNQMRGSITIIKDAVSNNAQDFQFTSSKLGTFYLDDDSNANLSNEHTFSNLGSDSYTITESETSGWKLSDITCSAKDAEISLVNRSVSLNIDEPGEAITCTFKNSQLGSIQIVKNTTGSNGRFSFTTTGGSTLPSGFELTTINGTNSVTYTGIDPDLTYSITETVPDGWTQTSATCTGTNTPSKITPNAGEAVVCTFENTRDTGSITVKKIIDVDGNSETVEDQTLGAYWQFDVDGDSQDTTDASADLTTSAGLLSFSQLKSGTYSIVETTQKGYTLASAYCSNESGVFDKVDSLSGVSVDKDENVTCTFINKPNGTIHGYKWHDEDMDGEFGEGEDKLSGWTINLYDWNTELRGFNTTPIKSMVTDSGETHFGWYWFENLTPGRYKVCEENQEGWSQTYPDNCHLLSLPDGNSSGFEQMDNAVSGPVYKFGNVQLAELTVIKYSDDNQNGKMDEDEGTLEGWEINLSEIESDGDSKITDEDGSVLFENIIPGEYELSETQQDGWYQSNIYCPNLDDRRENLFSQEFYTGSRNISLSAGDQYTCYIGNYSDPEIHISKYNDSVGSKTPGGSVTFRILLNILKAKVNNLTVKDLLPKGFAYRAGSYQVKINGSIVSISEPEYHSPGKWEIGSVNEGDEIELLYIADISSDTLPGDYLDAVWAVGKSLAGDNVLALANEDSYVDEHFAGTTVAIVKDQTRTDDYGVEKKEEVVGQVLGATTSLPATGANELWIIVSIASLYLGIKLVTSAKSK